MNKLQIINTNKLELILSFLIVFALFSSSPINAQSYTEKNMVKSVERYVITPNSGKKVISRVDKDGVFNNGYLLNNVSTYTVKKSVRSFVKSRDDVVVFQSWHRANSGGEMIKIISKKVVLVIIINMNISPGTVVLSVTEY